jgi:hypothetical protein
VRNRAGYLLHKRAVFRNHQKFLVSLKKENSTSLAAYFMKVVRAGVRGTYRTLDTSHRDGTRDFLQRAISRKTECPEESWN